MGKLRFEISIGDNDDVSMQTQHVSEMKRTQFHFSFKPYHTHCQKVEYINLTTLVTDGIVPKTRYS